MKTRRRIMLLILAAALCLGAVTVFAVTRRADNTLTGAYEQPFIDRVNIAVSQTEFIFDSPKNGDELVCPFTFSISKSEAEFYARLDSLAVEGDGLTCVTYTARDDSALAPERVVLTSNEGKPTELSWDISFTAPYKRGGAYNAVLKIVYTSGADEINCDSHIKEIPLKILTEG